MNQVRSSVSLFRVSLTLHSPCFSLCLQRDTGRCDWTVFPVFRFNGATGPSFRKALCSTSGPQGDTLISSESTQRGSQLRFKKKASVSIASVDEEVHVPLESSGSARTSLREHKLHILSYSVRGGNSVPMNR